MVTLYVMTEREIDQVSGGQTPGEGVETATTAGGNTAALFSNYGNGYRSFAVGGQGQKGNIPGGLDGYGQFTAGHL